MNPQVGMPQSSGLHDIEELIPYQEPWELYIAAFLAAVLLGLLAWWLWRRFGQKTKVKVTPPRDPWEVLQEDLFGLDPYLAAGASGKDFYYQLSLGLRRAMELRSGVRATDMTIRELRAPLYDKVGLPTQDCDLAFDLLQRADLIKFADQPSHVDEAKADIKQVLAWVERLRQPPPVESNLPGLPTEQAAARLGVLDDPA